LHGHGDGIAYVLQRDDATEIHDERLGQAITAPSIVGQSLVSRPFVVEHLPEIAFIDRLSAMGTEV
jgi:hypothetical protein